MGAAVAARLRQRGAQVIGVDVRDAEVVADLSSAEERQRAVAAIDRASGGALDGLVACAGISGFNDLGPAALVSVNYFGTVVLLQTLRGSLAAAGGAAIAITSNAATTTPNIDDALVELCPEGDEAAARRRAQEIGGPANYSASKLAASRWVRRTAPSPAWAGGCDPQRSGARPHLHAALGRDGGPPDGSAGPRWREGPVGASRAARGGRRAH